MIAPAMNSGKQVRTAGHRFGEKTKLFFLAGFAGDLEADINISAVTGCL